ncbi:MAG: c-type cytochrome [Gemmatimonadales bacterium]
MTVKWISRLAVVGVLAACWACGGERLATFGSRGGQEAQTPAKFGIGRVAGAAEIAALDIDIMPDGTGLPAGSGTVADGRAVYAAKCAACHGATGTEGPFSALVGREPREGFPFAKRFGYVMTVGNYWPYATTLFDYTRRAMPFDRPGSLTDNEVYGLVAFLLYRNEIVTEDAVMNAETLPQVVMPAHDRFVRDNRKGGHEIK